MTTISRLLAKNKELREAATPGPWKFEIKKFGYQIIDRDGYALFTYKPKYFTDVCTQNLTKDEREQVATGELLVHARNTAEANDEMIELLVAQVKIYCVCGFIEGPDSKFICYPCSTLAKVEEIARGLE